MIEIADKAFTTTIINVLSNLKEKQIIRKNGNYKKWLNETSRADNYF